MGFTINDKIEIELTWQEVSAIACACSCYRDNYARTAPEDVLQTMTHLVDRLGLKLYNHPDNDKPNGH